MYVCRLYVRVERMVNILVFTSTKLSLYRYMWLVEVTADSKTDVPLTESTTVMRAIIDPHLFLQIRYDPVAEHDKDQSRQTAR